MERQALKWKSNSPDVMKALGANVVTEQKDMNFEQDSEVEKVLGMWWRLKKDCFTYSLRFNKGNSEVLRGELALSKVEMLRVLMSKVIMRETVRCGNHWNDVIEGETLLTWKKWLSLLPRVEDLMIPRCYLSSLESLTNITSQLHVVVDASDDCSAALAYLRIQSKDEVNCSIVAAKTKVAPVKLVSIPRLELAARYHRC